MCIVLWILKPYPVTSCSSLHKAGSTDGKLEGNYCTACCALYVQSQKVTQAHNCTELGSPGRKDGKKEKKNQLGTPSFLQKQLVSLSSLWATGLLNYLQCSASLFRLAQSQVCFQQSCSNRQRLLSLGHSSQSCSAPCWSCLKQLLLQ